KGMYGMHVHEAVLKAGERISGATVHQVNEKYDEGKILAQWEVPVKEDDTPETLQKRVLETEHKLYPDTIAKIARGEIKLNG
ncbi:MAG TPA: phosphoribosylglycinamide formyltransferase, partial [candidate division Zixibacteria bacterium]|nr:phosphoribosylglycinamide formyltransferase [candidate division Zixibacteria bacterium]